MKRKFLLFVMLAIILASATILGFLCCNNRRNRVPPVHEMQMPSATNTLKSAKKTTSSAKTNTAKPDAKKRRMIHPSRTRSQVSQGKRKILDTLLKDFLRRAIDDDNEKKVLKWASLAVDAKDAELRLEAVKALGWYGENAIPEILSFLEDPDETVAQEAFNQIDQSFDLLEDDAMLIKLVKLSMNYALDEDQAALLLSKLESVSESDAVLALADMMQETDSDTLLGELLRDEFEYITEEEYYSDTSARVWAVLHKNK